MKPTTYTFKFGCDDEKEVIVDHDPEETGIDVEAEYARYCEIGELSSGFFRPNLTDFGNFLWSELGLKTLNDDA